MNTHTIIKQVESSLIRGSKRRTVGLLMSRLLAASTPELWRTSSSRSSHSSSSPPSSRRCLSSSRGSRSSTSRWRPRRLTSSSSSARPSRPSCSSSSSSRSRAWRSGGSRRWRNSRLTSHRTSSTPASRLARTLHPLTWDVTMSRESMFGPTPLPGAGEAQVRIS